MAKTITLRKVFYLFVLVIITAVALSACSDDDSTDISKINQQTVLVYMPWSGSDNSQGLYPIFRQNLDSIEGAIIKANAMYGRLLVFISTSASTSQLYEVTYDKGQITHTPIKSYSGHSYNTAEGITEILRDVQANAYALNYSMIIGCHGTGWTFKDDWNDYPNSAKRHYIVSRGTPNGQPSSHVPYPQTRFFGSVTSSSYATDITTLAQGIEESGIKMQYILFDDCYMANVETAYELRNATNFLIGSTSEVIDIGMPYQTMWSSLAKPTPAYESAVTAFNTFYSDYSAPYGSLSAIDCREVEHLASVMKEINSHFTLADTLRDSIQVLDGFTTPIFYDLGDYVDQLCTNSNLLNSFKTSLDKVVRSTAHTETLYSYLYYGQPKYIEIKHFSGLTVSDCSVNAVAIKGRSKLSWWTATH